MGPSTVRQIDLQKSELEKKEIVENKSLDNDTKSEEKKTSEGKQLSLNKKPFESKTADTVNKDVSKMFEIETRFSEDDKKSYEEKNKSDSHKKDSVSSSLQGALNSKESMKISKIESKEKSKDYDK